MDGTGFGRATVQCLITRLGRHASVDRYKLFSHTTGKTDQCGQV